MRYSTPELVELGSASVLVLGAPRGVDDSSDPLNEKIPQGIAVGLDD